MLQGAGALRSGSVPRPRYDAAMSSFRFVHAADLHLDTPFEGLAGTAPHVAQSLREASLQAWDALVELCIAEEAAFLLLAGDVYDGAERGVRAQLRFLHGLQRLAEHGVQVFVAHGNHDPVDEGWAAVRRWPENTTVFPADEVAAVPAVREGKRLATVYGISYPRKACEENLALRFPSAGAPSIEAQGVQIGVLHCNAAGSAEHALYSPCSTADLLRCGYDYWALGHLHRRQTLHAGSPWIAYPGDLQGRSPKPAESEPKGALVVEVRDDRVREVRFVACDRLRFVHVRLDVGLCADVAELQDALLAQSAHELEAAQGRGLLLRVHLEGRGAVHADLRAPDAAGELLQALRELSVGATPLIWWESIKDASRPALDRRTLRARGDFSAELLALTDDLRQEPEAAAQLVGAFPADLRRALGAQPDVLDDLNELLDRAETRALDVLEGGAP